MNSVAVSHPKRPARGRLTLRALHDELNRLRERVEDLEDLRELNAAIARNGRKKLIPWEQAKRELGVVD
jgi:hypothetical protein